MSGPELQQFGEELTKMEVQNLAIPSAVEAAMKDNEKIDKEDLERQEIKKHTEKIRKYWSPEDKNPDPEKKEAVMNAIEHVAKLYQGKGYDVSAEEVFDLIYKDKVEEVKENNEAMEAFGKAIQKLVPRAPTKWVEGEHCNMYATDLAEYLFKRFTGSKMRFPNIHGKRDSEGNLKYERYVAHSPISEKSIKQLRGKSIKELTDELVIANMKPGQVIFSNSSYLYKGKYSLKEDASIQLPSSNTFTDAEQHRHWFTYIGSKIRGDKKVAVFADNLSAKSGRRYYLKDVKKRYGGSERVIVNVHDPLREIRNQFIAAYDTHEAAGDSVASAKDSF